MSVNIVQNGELLPIAGKTVPAPTPDYVDAQYSSSTTYSKGMTCIEGNVRYRYKNSTATSGHRPPNTTYWEVLSVSDELSALDTYVEGEVQIGYFLGKPLYRRVIKTNISISQNTTSEYSYPFSKIDGHIINIYAILDYASNTYLACNSSNTSAVGCWYSRAENKIRIFHNMTSTTIAYAIVIEYVKENWT